MQKNKTSGPNGADNRTTCFNPFCFVLLFYSSFIHFVFLYFSFFVQLKQNKQSEREIEREKKIKTSHDINQHKIKQNEF